MPDGAILHAPILSCPSSVRVATERDEEAIYDLLMALDADNGFGLPVSRERVMAHIQQGTRHQGGMIGVIEADGKIVGSIALVMRQFWYSDVWHLAEGWLFVRREYRASHRYRDLFRFAKWCAQQMGPEPSTGEPWQVVTSVWSHKRLDAKTRLWARFGTQVGAIFTMKGA